METNLLHVRSLSSTTIFFTSRKQNNPRFLRISPTKNSSSTNNNNISNDDVQVPPPPQITPPETVEIRFRKRSRKRRQVKDGDDDMTSKAETIKEAPKKWEAMSLGEKALELYMGEKGMLFWLNKFAYASIFIIIGGWILFRFVGPALNLYQLDTPPLSPTNILKPEN